MGKVPEDVLTDFKTIASVESFTQAPTSDVEYLKSIPHYAQINFHIDVFAMNSDGSLSTTKLSDDSFSERGMLPRAAFGIEGLNLEDCMQKIKQVLESLHYE